MSLWWCPACNALVGGHQPGVCGICGGATSYATIGAAKPPCNIRDPLHPDSAHNGGFGIIGLRTTMIHSEQVKAQVLALLARKISMAAFERWLATESLNMFSDSPDDAISLVAAINLLVSELHDDVIDNDTFRLELLPYVITSMQRASQG